jgi:hypothetical protein
MWPVIAFGGVIFGMRVIFWLYSRISRYFSRVF